MDTASPILFVAQREEAALMPVAVFCRLPPPVHRLRNILRDTFAKVIGKSEVEGPFRIARMRSFAKPVHRLPAIFFDPFIAMQIAISQRIGGSRITCCRQLPQVLHIALRQGTRCILHMNGRLCRGPSEIHLPGFSIARKVSGCSNFGKGGGGEDGGQDGQNGDSISTRLYPSPTPGDQERWPRHVRPDPQEQRTHGGIRLVVVRRPRRGGHRPLPVLRLRWLVLECLSEIKRGPWARPAE